MAAAVAVTVAFALITPGVYPVVAALLPIKNFPDLLAKYALFTGLLLAGTQIANAYQSPKMRRLIAGGPGTVVYICVCIAEAALFIQIHNGHQAQDLSGNLSDPAVRLYATITTGYAAYLAAAVIPTVSKGIASTQTTHRIVSLALVTGFGLAGVGFGCEIISLFWIPNAYWAQQNVSALSAVFVSIALAATFLARVRVVVKARLAPPE